MPAPNKPTDHGRAEAIETVDPLVMYAIGAASGSIVGVAFGLLLGWMFWG